MAVCHDEEGDTPTGRQSQRLRESSGPLCSLSPSFHEEGLRSLSIRDLSRFLPCSLLSLSQSLPRFFSSSSVFSEAINL